MTGQAGAWRVKYDGRCARCATPLLKGQPAVWERGTRTMRCIRCEAPAAPPTNNRPSIEAGDAGASAHREYDRRMTKRDAEARARWGDLLGGVVLALTAPPQSTRAWRLGSLGERKLAAAIAAIGEVVSLHDRSVPGTRANIDHLIVAPTGVFVIDAKRYTTRIYVRDVGPFWRSDVRLFAGGRDISKLADGLHWQADAVRQALSRGGVAVDVPIVPVLCFVDADWSILRAPTSFRDVSIQRPSTVRDRLAGTRVLGDEAVIEVARILARELPPAS